MVKYNIKSNLTKIQWQNLLRNHFNEPNKFGWFSFFYFSEKFLTNIHFWNHNNNSCDMEQLDLKEFEF